MIGARDNPYSIDQPAEALFYGRQDQVEKLAASLTAPTAGSFALIGGRRFGKTSLLHAVDRRLWAMFPCSSGETYCVIPIYLNFLGDEIAGLDDFFLLAVDILANQIAEHCLDIPPENWNTSSPADSSKPAHRTFADKIFKVCQSVIASRGNPARVLLLMDETEEILDKPWRHDLFNRLRWLVYENQRSRNHIKIILAGSSSFYDDVRQRSSPLWGVLTFEYLAAFPEEETWRLIQEPCNGQISQAVASKVAQCSGGHPYVVQYLMHHLWKERPSEILPRRVEGLSERFRRERWSQLDSWRKSIGKVGCQAYSTLLLRADWMEERSIRKAIGSPTPELVPALTALCYHGWAIHDDDWRYCAVGELTRDWFVENVTSNVEEEIMNGFADGRALLIGVGNYLHAQFPNLPATVRDAEAIGAILADPARCGYSSDKVEVISGAKATVASIRDALYSLSKSTNPQSTVLIYFSGHGGRVLQNDRWHTYLCPREADPANLTHTAISGDEFSELLASIPARKMLVILDACHAGGSVELKTSAHIHWKAGLSEDYYEAMARGSGRVVLASSKEEQVSYVRGELSLLTHYLVQALSGGAAVRGDGLIHILDVFHYVNEAVQQERPGQIPILKVKDLDLNFPIALDRGGKGASSSQVGSTIITIREQIIYDPINGAKALSEYLKTKPDLAGKRDEVDLKRAELVRIQQERELFDSINDNDKSIKNRTLFFLLRVCRELEGRPEL
jgi:hypothetical protein